MARFHPGTFNEDRFFNDRAYNLTQLVGALYFRWRTKGFKNVVTLKKNPVTRNWEVYVRGYRIGSEGFHDRFSQHLRFYKEYSARISKAMIAKGVERYRRAILENSGNEREDQPIG